ncbi:MAG: zinc-ribbon domain-containing protein [Clostridiales bacterium]|nr:zinc-ribbon domain-containing protein [Clostridiales bacterium]
MQCTNCGKEMDGSVKFCPECGSQIGGFQGANYGQQPVNRGVVQSNINMEPDVKRGMLFSSCRLVIGIVSIVLFFWISFQSCAVGVANTLEGNGKVSGTAGMVLAVSWLVAGIVGIAGRKHIPAVATASGFYFFGALMGMVDVGIYIDLIIWSALSLSFGLILLLAILLRKKEIFWKTGVSVLTELGIMGVMLGVAFVICIVAEAQDEEASYNSSQQSTVSQEQTGGEEKKEAEEKKETKAEAAESGQVDYWGEVSDLLQEMNDNPVAAKEKYLNKVMRLTGQISYIGGEKGSYYVSLADPFDAWQIDSIDCYVADEVITKVKNGDFATITGRIEEGFMGLEMKDCEIVNSKTPTAGGEAFADEEYADESVYHSPFGGLSIAGYYGGSLGQSVLTINMYSAPEGEAIGNAEIYIDSEHPTQGGMSYYGELIEVMPGLYDVVGNSGDSVSLIYFEDNGYTCMSLLVNEEVVEEYTMIESFES